LIVVGTNVVLTVGYLDKQQKTPFVEEGAEYAYRSESNVNAKYVFLMCLTN